MIDPREVAIKKLESEDPSERFQAQVDLRFDYSAEVGEALVQRCILEKAPGVWWLSALSAIPLWLPLFDRTLAEARDWPFSAAKTLKLIELAGRFPLLSAGPFIEDWASGEDWVFRFVALRWLQSAGSQDEVCELANQLLMDMSEFRISEVDRAGGPWMRDFGDVNARKEELVSLINDLCEE